MFGLLICNWMIVELTCRRFLATTVPVPSGGSQLDVQSGDSELFAALGDILSGQHGSVWRRLISVCLHLHPTGHAADRFPGNKCNGQTTCNHQVLLKVPCWCFHLLARQVSDVDKGVVERSEDVTHTKHVLSFGHLRTQADNLLLLLLFPFTRSHCLKMDSKTSRSYTSVPLFWLFSEIITTASYQLWANAKPRSSQPNKSLTKNSVFYVTHSWRLISA